MTSVDANPTQLRVLDAGIMIGAPFVATMLGDLGADVIKVERPGMGDIQRYMGPGPDQLSYRWQVDARNKRSITLDITTPEGHELFVRLVEWADVLVENNRPGVMARLGLGYEDLQKVNPRLVYVSVSGYGQTGPYRERPGYDFAGAAFGGLTYVNGYPDRPPVLPGLAIVDYNAALFATIGALEALRRRDAPGGTGRGEWIDVGLYEPMIRISSHNVPLWTNEGRVVEREGATPVPGAVPNAPHGMAYPTSDGHYLSIFAITEAQYLSLVRLIGADELDDPALAKIDARSTVAPRVDAALRPWVEARTREDAMRLLVEADIVCSPINSAADIVVDPHILERENVVRVTNAQGTEVTVPGVVPRLVGEPGSVRWTGQELGASNEDVYLGLLGLDPGDYERLCNARVI